MIFTVYTAAAAAAGGRLTTETGRIVQTLRTNKTSQLQVAVSAQ